MTESFRERRQARRDAALEAYNEAAEHEEKLVAELAEVRADKAEAASELRRMNVPIPQRARVREVTGETAETEEAPISRMARDAWGRIKKAW